MRPPRRAVALLLLSAAACADLKDIIALQRDLAREFQSNEINININNGVHLTVTFVNSPVAELADPEQAAFARRVAEHVRDHYARYSQLQTISVGFSSVRGAAGLKYSRSSLPYRFTPGELGAPRKSPKTSAPKVAV